MNDTPSTSVSRRRGRIAIATAVLVVVIAAVLLGIAVVFIRRNAARTRRRAALEDAGRVLQSAFDDGRRAAITKRRPHRLILIDRPARWELRIVDTAIGAGVASTYSLPYRIGFDSTVGPDGDIQIAGCGATVHADVPPAGAAAAGTFTFLRDGTIELSAPAADAPPPEVGGRDLFDLDPVRDRIPLDLESDIRLLHRDDAGLVGYVDVNPSTGRVRFVIVAPR